MKNNFEKEIIWIKKREEKTNKQKVFIVFLITDNVLGVDSVWSSEEEAVKRAWQLTPDYSELQDWEFLRLDELRNNMILLKDKRGNDIHIREYEVEDCFNSFISENNKKSAETSL